MVHALKEAWRVLVRGGIMIDVRPLSVDVPLEVVFAGSSQIAGMVDCSPDLVYDIAADKAIDSVVRDNIFTQTDLVIFPYAYYWKTYRGMIKDFKERWEGELIVSKDVLDAAQRLYKQHYPRSRMHLPMKMKLAKYVRVDN